MKLYIIISIIFFILGSIVGNWFNNHSKLETDTQTHEQVNNHTVVTTITTKMPDGETKVIQTTDSLTKETETQKSEAHTVLPTNPKVNVSLLVGNDFSRPQILPLYGVSVSKEILGPITVGAFGLTNGVIGLSLGINF